MEKDFLFTGMIHCGHCGCLLVGDIKKQKYIYYRCSHAKGRCPEPYVREEALIEQYRALLGPVHITEKVLHWLTNALKASQNELLADHAHGVRRLEEERNDLRKQM